MRYLAQRVHAGIGSPASGDAGLVVGDARQGFFQFALHGRFLALDLPAQELTAVVFNAECVTQGLHEVQHLLGLGLLFLASAAGDLFQDDACGFLVAHGNVSARQVELNFRV